MITPWRNAEATGFVRAGMLFLEAPHRWRSYSRDIWNVCSAPPKSVDRAPRFNIGQKFKTSGKHPREMIVTDILKTFNSAGQLVRIRYVAQHEFLGQTVTDHDVLETTIARNRIVEHVEP